MPQDFLAALRPSISSMVISMVTKLVATTCKAPAASMPFLASPTIVWPGGFNTFEINFHHRRIVNNQNAYTHYPTHASHSLRLSHQTTRTLSAHVHFLSRFDFLHQQNTIEIEQDEQAFANIVNPRTYWFSNPATTISGVAR